MYNIDLDVCGCAGTQHAGQAVSLMSFTSISLQFTAASLVAERLRVMVRLRAVSLSS